VQKPLFHGGKCTQSALPSHYVLEYSDSLLVSLIQRRRIASVSATAAAGRVGFGRRGSRTPAGGRPRRRLKRPETQRTGAVSALQSALLLMLSLCVRRGA
jgi:hypothetical protein